MIQKFDTKYPNTHPLSAFDRLIVQQNHKIKALTEMRDIMRADNKTYNDYLNKKRKAKNVD